MKCKQCKAELEDYPVTIFGVNGGPDTHAYAYKCPNGCAEPMDKCRMCGETEYYTKETVGEMEIDVVHCPNDCKDPMSEIDTWCYQILKHNDTKNNVIWFGLHEVYKDAEGNMITYTLEPEVVSESVQGILIVLNSMRHDARTKPVICVTDDETTASPDGAQNENL